MSFNNFEAIPIENAGDKISEFLNGQNPDIFCIQEHSRIRYRQLRNYKYRAETPYTSRRTIQAIFSKYPIFNKGSLEPKGTTNNIIYADIALPKDTIRVYNVHFESFKIIPSKENLNSDESVRLAKRIKQALGLQLNQVAVLRAHLQDSPYKTIVCGDFNATQFSNIYRIASEGLQDTFLEKGNGLGRTYSLKGLPLRIDYILADPSFEVLDHKNFDVKYSDHYPVAATLRLKSHQ